MSHDLPERYDSAHVHQYVCQNERNGEKQEAKLIITRKVLTTAESSDGHLTECESRYEP